tara:strand:+ start:2463 stop:2609 length:147 start_codon:yes stop_codon:yes gene_type:complete
MIWQSLAAAMIVSAVAVCCLWSVAFRCCVQPFYEKKAAQNTQMILSAI